MLRFKYMGILGLLGILAAGLFFGGIGGLGENSGRISGKYPVNPPKQPISSCKAYVEPDKVMRVDVSPEKEGFYKEKEEKLWVLIKTNAYIPSWKVEREMTPVGRTIIPFPDDLENPFNQNPDTPDKVVYIGTGHCRGNPNSGKQACRDPLVQDALFVVGKEGKSDRKIGSEKDPEKWWEFNVYIDRSDLPADPHFEDLPCWARMACATGDISGRRRDEIWEKYLRTGICEIDEADAGAGAASYYGQNYYLSAAGEPSFVLAKDIEKKPGFSEELGQVYWFDSELDTHPKELGFVLAGNFSYGKKNYKVYYDSAGGTITLVLLPEEKKFSIYVPIGETKKPAKGNRSLQLGTFYPKVEREFAYEWWTPACKPAIYLYPEKPMRLNVKVKPQGKLTKTIPQYPTDGWEVFAYPSGKLVENTAYYNYLFYEANIEKLKVPKKGWVVGKDYLPAFFTETLGKLGLNDREIRDFKQYWVKKLSEAPYYFVGLVNRRQLDKVEAVKFSREPDTFIRVRFVFERLSSPMSVEPPIMPKKAAREGFVAVDWGGVLVDGSCGEGM